MRRFSLALLAPKIVLVLIGVGLTSSKIVEAAPNHTLVPGFERLFKPASATEETKRDAGLVLVGELGCANCHQVNDPAKAHISTKQAPILDAVGSRVRPEYLRQFIADPQHAKPGTTMPDVLAGWNQEERDAAVEALTHFLATTGSIADSPSSARFVPEGDRLYHRVGCVACHGSRREGATPLPTDVPLGALERKYTITSLTAFLNEPHKVRPSGRMPWFHWENGEEVRSLAHYLCQSSATELVANTRYRYHEGTWETLPDFAALQPAAVGKSIGFDLGIMARPDNFAIVFEGTVELPKDADYTFFLFSDDGSRLMIDDAVVVDHNGTHSGSDKSGVARLAKGPHRVQVDFFQGSGGAELRVDLEHSGLSRHGLEALLQPLEPPKQPQATPPVFLPDAALAAKGRELFSTVGCANCHSLNHRNEQLKPDEFTTVPPLAASGGCISEARAKGWPHYALSPGQRTALQSAIQSLATATGAPTPEQTIARTLSTFNCLACHERNKLGGVADEHSAHFETTTKEMGDEGRLPPTLTNVGAKLTKDWLDGMWDNGHKVRPYMLTRMPRFGRGNVGQLTAAFAATDKLAAVPAIAFGSAKSHARRDGRLMVGAKAFGCIKCHNFNGAASTGINAMDLAHMTGRLQHDWFHHYVLNPQAFRPGTRMPSAWPLTGKSYLPQILDGDVPKQIEAVWLYLLDRDRAAFPEGLGRDPIELIAEKTPVLYRNFIEGAGTRAIGVGYPEHVNLAFDAGDMRLALIWQGAFIDASRHWRDRGGGNQNPLGENVLRLPEGSAFALLGSPEESWPAKHAKELGVRWRGYRLNEQGQPTFLYELAGVKIEDQPQPIAGDPPALKRVITLTANGPINGLHYRAAKGNKVEPQPDGSFRIDEALTLRLRGGEKPLVRRDELLLPVKFNGNTATIEQHYLW